MLEPEIPRDISTPVSMAPAPAAVRHETRTSAFTRSRLYTGLREGAVATAIIGLTALAQWLAWPFLEPFGYILFYPAVTLAALYGDGRVAIFFAALVSQYLFVPPYYEFDFGDTGTILRTLIFVASASLVVEITSRLRQAKLRIQQAHDESEQSLAALNSFLESAPFGIAIIDKDLRYLRVNEQLARINGPSVQDHLGKSIFQVLDDASVAEPLLRGVIDSGAASPVIEYDAHPASDPKNLHHYLVHFYPVKTTFGRTFAVGGIIVDVTERKKAELALVESERRLKEVIDLREQFVSALTHDLRTPLTAAKIAAQIASRSPGDPDRVIANCAKIVQSVGRADKMIRDLLDANVIRTGQRLPISTIYCDLVEVVRQTIEELATIHGDRFVLHTTEGSQGYWDCDAIRRVLENLCNNAVKYGSLTDPIQVEIANSEDITRIAVTNFGNPIPLQNQKRLFEHFHRTDTAHLSGQHGWGIGLTLVKGVVESHGGTVSVRSSDGDGTTFEVCLPNRLPTA